MYSLFKKNKNNNVSIQILIEKLVKNEITILEFEDAIYRDIKLEHVLGEVLYIELVSFNYKQKDGIYQLLKLVTDKVVTQDEVRRWQLQKLFSKYGWFEGRKVRLKRHKKSYSKAYDYATTILKEFGGIEIEEINQDGYRRRGFLFFKQPSAGNIEGIGSVYFFAETDRSYSFIAVDEQGKYYVFIESVDLYFYCGEDFYKVMSYFLDR